MNIYSCQIFVFQPFSGYNFFCPYIIANKIHFSTVKAASFTPQNLAIFFQKRIYIPRNLVLWKTLCLTRFFPCALAVFFRLPALPFRALKNYCQQMHISVSIVLKKFFRKHTECARFQTGTKQKQTRKSRSAHKSFHYAFKKRISSAAAVRCASTPGWFRQPRCARSSVSGRNRACASPVSARYSATAASKSGASSRPSMP